MTETNAQGVTLTGEAFHLKSDSAGFPILLSIFASATRKAISCRRPIAEIWVRSCTNIREYWHRPEVNAAEIRDGWLKTGDIGYLDGDGFLFLADRAKI